MKPTTWMMGLAFVGNLVTAGCGDSGGGPDDEAGGSAGATTGGGGSGGGSGNGGSAMAGNAGSAAMAGSGGSAMAGNAGSAAMAGSGGSAGGAGTAGAGGSSGGGGAPSDRDGDGISDGDEMALGTDPDTADSDDDGLDDALEIQSLVTPLDTDGDGIIDALEPFITDNDLDGIWDYQDPTSGWQVAAGRFRPAVIANDGVSATTAEVRLTNTAGLTRVALWSSAAAGSIAIPDELLIDGVPLGAGDLELFDDGTRGDRYAGDGVFSRGNITTTMAIRSETAVRDHLLFHTLRVTGPMGDEERQLGNPNEQGRFLQYSLGYWLGVVEESALSTPVTLPDGTQKVPYIINIADTELWLNAKLSLITATQSTTLPTHLQAARVLELIEGDVDFVGFFPDTRVAAPVAGVHLQASNGVQGIGREPLVAGPEWSAESDRFKAAIAFNPEVYMPMVHEVLHQWAAYFDPSFGFLDGHWGAVGAYGVLGGFDPATLVDNMDGTYSTATFSPVGNDWLTTRLSDIELYTMGLVGIEAVEPMTVFPDFSILEDDFVTAVIEGTPTTVSIEDIVALHGPRVPDVASSQRDFVMTFVVCSERPLTVPELSWFAAAADVFGRPSVPWDMTFEDATGGLATLDTLVPPLMGE